MSTDQYCGHVRVLTALYPEPIMADGCLSVDLQNGGESLNARTDAADA